MKEYEMRAKAWLEGAFDEVTKAEILEMQKNPSLLEDAFYRNLEFGTGGMRGVMGAGTNRMNRYTVGMATQGLANYLKKHGTAPLSVCVSYDSRNNSRAFADVTADVLSANGIRVFLFSEIHPVPLMSFSVRYKKADAGVMITASHNPKEYNGYKLFWSDGAQITSPVDKEILAEIAAVGDPSTVLFERRTELVEPMGREIDEAYYEAVLPLALAPESGGRHSDIKIVYTPLHGCGVRIVPEALGRLGFRNVISVKEQQVPDGNFPTVTSPNPEEPAALRMAIDLADRLGADIVMGTDPDADRMGIAVRDPQGRMTLFNGNRTAAMLTYYLLSRRKELGTLSARNYVVKTIVTTPLIADIAESFGIECFDVLTGFKYIAEVVRRNEGRREFVCGGEESFGFNVGEFVRDKDAPISCCLVAQCAAWAAEQGLSLYGLMEKIYSIYGRRAEALASLVRKGRSGEQEIASMMKALRENPPAFLAGSPVVRTVDYKDGASTGLPQSDVLQFFSADGSVVTVRPSGTEPKIKFYFGAKGDDAEGTIEDLKRQFV